MALGLYARLVDLTWRRRATVIPRRQRAARSGAVTEFPASLAQIALWLATRAKPSDSGHHGATVRRLRGALRSDVLARAVHEVASRHEVLRTTLSPRDGHLVQVVHPNADVDWGIESCEPTREPEAWARTRCTELLSEPFDLERPCGLRARLLLLGPDDHVLFLGAHHLFSDVASLSLLHREIETYYDALVTGTPPVASDPLQYGDFAAWQEGWIGSDDGLQQLAYWRKELAGAPKATKLPGALHARARTGVAGRQKRAFEPAVVARLRALVSETETTLFVAGFALFAAWLHQTTGQNDIVVLTPVRNRLRPGADGVVGPMANRIALRARVNEATSFRALLTEMTGRLLDGLANQEVPFERVVGELDTKVRSEFLPFSQIVLQHVRLHAPGGAAELSSEYFPIHLPTLGAIVHLVIMDGDGISFDAHYRADLIDDSSIEAMLGEIAALADAVTLGPASLDRPIGEFAARREAPDSAGPISSLMAPTVELQSEPARTATEARLLELWRRALGFPALGVTDDFFEVGGHSLVALQLFAAIEREFGRRLPLTAILDRPTVEAMAALLDGG